MGQGVRDSGVDRAEVFLTTKPWMTEYGFDSALRAFDTSAANLGVAQIDLLILHQPMPQHFERTIGAYTALERLLADGNVRSIADRWRHLYPGWGDNRRSILMWHAVALHVAAAHFLQGG